MSVSKKKLGVVVGLFLLGAYSVKFFLFDIWTGKE